MLTHHDMTSAKENRFVAAAKFIGDLPTYQYAVDISTTVETVATTLKKNPDTHGVLLLDGKTCFTTASRLKIFEWLGRPYGVDLFYKKPIRELFANTKLCNEILPHDLGIDEAVKLSLSREPEVRYEPVVVRFEGGELHLLDMNVLLLAQSDQLSNVNRVIEKQVEIGRVLSSTLNLSKVLELILEQMDSIIPYSRASILLYQKGTMEFAAFRGYPEDINMDEAREMVNESEIYVDVINSRQPTTVVDATLRDDWRHIPGTAPTRSWLGVPLLQGENVLGMLSISRLTIAPFNLTEVETSSIFAGQAAVALANADLYQKIQSFNHQLEARVQERTEELQQAYIKLELLDKRKSDFIKLASHELRTPMTVISGYSQILMMDNTLNPRHRDLIRSMLNGIDRLGEIINTMFDVARLDSREMKLEIKDVDVYALLISIAEELSQNMKERRIQHKITNVDAFPMLRGDSRALRKAFYHLVVNAIKYTPDGGRITINGRMPGSRDEVTLPDTVQVTVTDTGIGIDPKDHELIFDKFYQNGFVMRHSSGKTKFKGGGAGLGLAVARGIIETHGGQVWVKSSGQDETTCPGSSFHVVLPLSALDVSDEFKNQSVETFQR